MCRFAGAMVVLALCFASGLAQAGALQVSPLGARLSAQRPIATLRVRNVDVRQVIVQADVVAWSQPQGEDVYAPTDRIVVIPPIFSLEPGSQQLLRIGIPGPMPASEVERAFRVFLHELQPIEAQRGDRLNLALRIGLPIFVAPQVAAPAGELSWGIEGVGRSAAALRVANRSPAHIKIVAVRFMSRDGALAEEVRMLRYCLPGAAAAIPLPALDGADDLAAIQVVFRSRDRTETEHIALHDGSLAVR